MSTADSDLLVHARDDGPPPYDFARPLAFAARYLRAAERAHAAAADTLAQRFSDRFGEPVEAEPGAVDEVRIVDFERSRELPCALFRARLDGHEVGIDVPPALALFVVERHLGGTDPLSTESRSLSDLERRVTESQGLPDLLGALAASWGAHDVRLDGFADRPDTLNLGPSEEPATVGDITLTIGEVSATLTVCYPAHAFRALVASAETAPAASDAPAANVDGLPLELRAEFGRTRLPVSDLVRLAPGDVIPLGRAPEAPVPVWIGDRLRFEAAPGRSGARLALHLLAPSAPPSDD
ncbi:MAG: FliM/FliN family flagellar motor switch protein [Bacteroidota bacterium]